jgi:hypothetical protein
LDDWIYCTLYSHNSGLQVIQRYRWSTHSSPLHTLWDSRSSLVVSWQRIYNSLSLQITWGLLYTAWFLSFHLFTVTFDCHRQNSTHFSTTLERPSCPSARVTQKTQPLCCWEGLFTDTLSSNGRPIVARVRFRRNVFTDSSPSNESIRHSSMEIEVSNRQHYIGHYNWPGISGKHVLIHSRQINSLKPSGYYMYRLLWHTKTLHSAHRVYLWVPYEFHNKQQLSPYTALTGWAL